MQTNIRTGHKKLSGMPSERLRTVGTRFCRSGSCQDFRENLVMCLLSQAWAEIGPVWTTNRTTESFRPTNGGQQPSRASLTRSGASHWELETPGSLGLAGLGAARRVNRRIPFAIQFGTLVIMLGRRRLGGPRGNEFLRELPPVCSSTTEGSTKAPRQLTLTLACQFLAEIHALPRAQHFVKKCYKHLNVLNFFFLGVVRLGRHQLIERGYAFGSVDAPAWGLAQPISGLSSRAKPTKDQRTGVHRRLLERLEFECLADDGGGKGDAANEGGLVEEQESLQ